jgi:hypothetical protein
MSERAPIPASQRYRALAEECRTKAKSFRDQKARTRMLQLAADYDRKALQAEASETDQPEGKQSDTPSSDDG